MTNVNPEVRDPQPQQYNVPPAPISPVAIVKPSRRLSWTWLFPALAILLAGWLLYNSWSMRGVNITVQLENGHGLKAGDDIRFRGIRVGKVDSITLLDDLQNVSVAARLTVDAQQLARAGSRFWVVRPQLHLTRAEGLETLIGPRYLAVLPAHSNGQVRIHREFVGLDEPPIVEAFSSGDLEIILQSPQRGSLHPGAPVTFRQTRVGTILSVGLAPDSSSVEARVHIQQPYVQLVRPQTQFWDVGGLQAKLGLTGVSIDIDSAEALLSGGVALATPPPTESSGDIVRTGHRFRMAQKPEKEWYDWQPLAAIGNSLLPPGVSAPTALRATLGWKQGRIGNWIKGQRLRHGWVLQTNKGLLGPTNLFKPDSKADDGSVVLEIAGTTISLDAPVLWEHAGVSLLQARLNDVEAQALKSRRPEVVEECLLIADPAASPLPLAASRLTAKGDHWEIDRALAIDPVWHGASVLSRLDGKIIGLLLIEGDIAKVALLPKQAD